MGRPKPSPLPPVTTTVGFSARSLWLCLLLCAAGAQSVLAADYTYVKVGNPAQTGSSALAMDNNGRVATTSLIRSYLFADNFFANYVEITNVNIATSTPGLVAQGLNDAGELVGRFRTNGAPANQTRGFIRRADGTFEPFDYPGVASTSVSEINNHGNLVGETRSDLTSFGLIRGFVHTNGVSAEIHFPGATLTRGYGINDDGDIVGQYQREDGVSRPFLLRNGVYSQIVPTNAPGGLVSGIAFSISDNGLVLGTYRDLANVSKTWVMRADGSFEYPALPGTGRVINKAGQIAGSFADPANANATTPFVATPFVPANYVAHRMALTNSASGSASKINDQGQITGTVDGTDGVSRGYRFDTKTRQEVERGGFGESSFTEWGGINSAGTLAGYYADPADPSFNTYRAFVRDAGGNFQSIIWSGDTNFGFTVDIDDHGRVAGGGGTTAWVWDTNGTFNVFNVPGFTVNGAFGMNDHGLVVGAAWPGFFDTPNGLIYNISNNTATIWNYPAAAQTTLYGINNRGDIVGEFKPNLTSANIPFVRWADGTTQILNFAGLAGVRVYDINDDRVVVGRYKDGANKNRPFFAMVWTPLVPFSQPLPVGGALAGVSSISPADFDGDGDPDLLAGAYGANRISWFPNLGGGLFGSEQVIDATADSVWFTKAGDLDGDGDIDALGGMYSGTLEWYENNGAGTFSKHVLDTNNVGPWLEIADLDGDGRVDVLAAPDGGSEVMLYRGLANGFATGTTLVSGFGGVGGVFVRDINGDGHRDLLLGDYRDEVMVWYLNQGGGVLGPKQTIAAGDGGGMERVIDLDGDGLLDIVSLEYVAEAVSWYKNIGAGAFGSRQVLPFNVSGPYAVTVDDFDGDGDLDVAVATYSNAPDFYWSANQGNGVFGVPLLVSKSLGQVSMLTSGDFDGDGDKDIAAGSFSGGQIFLFKNQRGANATIVVAPADGKYLLGQSLDTTVYFGFPVTVAGRPQIDLQIGTKLVTVDYLTGSGTPSLTFRHTIIESDADTDGVALVSANIRLNGGAILDPFNGAATLGLTPGTWTNVLVSGSAPFVVSIQRSGATPTDANEVSFVVTFNEPVTGFDSADLGLVASGGITGTTVNEVSGSGATYSVRVGTGSGSGTIGLTVLPLASLTDTNGVALGSAFAGGEVFTLLRGPAHTITNFYPSGHGDIAVGYDSNGWNVTIDSDDFGAHGSRDVLIYGGPEGLTTRGSSPLLDFLGVGAGQPLYVWPDNGVIPTLPELGVGGEGIPGGTAAAYFNADPRVNASGPWVNVRLAAVRAPAGAHLSVYTVSPLGNPVVWWATSDGLSPEDTLTILEGSHQHFNFAFTKPGIYEADIIVSGYRDANGNGVYDAGADPYIESGVETLYFAINPPFGMQSYTIPGGMTGRRPMPAFTFENIVATLPGATETLLSDIDNDGGIVGRFKDALGESQGLIIDGTNQSTFNITGTTATFPGGFNSLGVIAGFYRNATNAAIQHGFLRDTNGTVTTIDGAVPGTTYVWRVNDRGEANGYWFEESPFFIRSFRRDTNGTLTTFVYPGSPVGTVTRGMNEAGDLAGWKWTDAFALEGVVFKRDGTTNVFTVPGWANTLPGDINNLGDVAGTVINADFTKRAGFFRRANGDTVVFTPPQAIEVEVFGLNDQAEIVGEYVTTGGSRLGFVARPAMRLDRGHTDAGLAYEDGEFEFHIHDEENDVEYAVNEAVLAVGTAAEQTIPDEVAYSFLGRAGYSTWVLPAVQNEELLFLGIAAEEIGTGIFVNDQIRVELVFVQGNGDFALYSIDGLGNPVIHMNTADGYDDQDAFVVKAGSHVDLNWAFSAPGTYRVGLRARATLVEGKAEVESETAYCTFTVPEPLRTQPVESVEELYTITDIGTLGGPSSFALDVNESAQVTGNARYTTTNSRLHGFAWDKEAIRDLGYLTNGMEFSRGYAINDAGIIVGESDNDISKAFLWDGANMVQLGTLGGTSAVAHDINNVGEIVGASSNGSASRPYKRDAAGMMHDLGTLLGTTSSSGRAWGINQSGAVVGLSRNEANTTSQATLWIGGSISNLGSLVGGTLFSQAYAINDNNVVVGSSVVGKVSPTSSTDLSHAFVWKDGVMTDLGAHPSHTNYIHSEAKDINNAGEIVGYTARFFSSPTSGGAAMLWRNGEAIDLNTLVPPGSGWVLQSAEGINEHGDIVGYGSFKGQTRAFLLRRATIYAEGHADFAFDYANGAWHQRMRNDNLGTNLEPATVLIRGNVASQLVVPTDLPPAYEFLGNAGDTVWILPEVQDPRLPFLGLAAEGTGVETFMNREIRVQLLNVEGPGQFITSDAGFTEPRVFFNTRDGVGPADFYPLSAGSHAHLNWIFTSPGYYRVTLQARGTLVDGGIPTSGSPVTYHFQIIGIETRLRMMRGDSGLKVVFSTQAGVNYQLERAPDASGPWGSIGQPFVGTGRVKEISVPETGGSAFFRVNAGVSN